MSSPRLGVYRPDEKRDTQVKTRRRAHAAAFVVGTERITRHIAEEIGRPGMRLLEEIGHGEKRGPAEVLEQIVSVARDHKDEAHAIAPVRVLAARLGYDLAPQVSGGVVRRDVVETSSAALAEVGEAVRAALLAARDGRVSRAEGDHVETEIEHAIEQLHRLKREMRAQATTAAPLTIV